MASLQARLLLLLVATSALLEAQEVRVLDLLNVNQRTELRFPPTPSDCIPGERCVGGGVGGGSVADGVPDPRDPRALGVALDRVTPADITLDAFEAEFRLLNTGLAPINVPVWPHLSDLQPSSESQPFSYLSLALEVRLSGTGPAQASGVGWVELYGSTQREDTIITLKPGEWVRVKAKVKLHTWPTKPIEAQLRGDFWFHDNVFKPQIGGAFTEAVNVYPNHTLYPAVAVHFSPTHRKTVAVVIRRTLEKLLPSKPAQEESRLRDALQTTFSDKNPDARISARPGPDGGSQRRYVPTAIVNESTVERAARQP